MKKIKLICIIIGLSSGYVFADNNFPLGGQVSQQNQNNSQQVVIPQPVMNNQNSNGAVPQIGTISSTASQPDPVNSGNIVVQNSGGFSSKMLNNNDNATVDLNTYKKQEEAKKLAAQNGYMQPAPLSSGTEATIPAKPITASMIGYLILDGGQKLATIQYGDGSTLEVQVGSLVAGYKVIKITQDVVSLTKYDKTVTGQNTIYVRKGNPVMSNSGTMSYSNSQQFDMDKINKSSF